MITRGFLVEGDDPLGHAHQYKAFMWRRATRIIPVYLLYLVIASTTLLAVDDAANLGDMPFMLTFTYNFQRIFDFVPVPHRFMPFEPLWTLSVEQQFYLLFPLLFLFVSRRNFVRIAVGLIVLAPLARMLFSWRLASAGMDPAHQAFGVFAASFCQYDAFLIGGLIAERETLIRNDPSIHRRLAIATGIVTTAFVLVMMAVNYNLGARGVGIIKNIFSGVLAGQGREVACYVAVDLISAVVLVGAIRQLHAFRFLASPLMSWVGKVSYGGYLYHALVLWFLFRLVGTAEVPASLALRIAIFIACWLITIALASLTFRVFEQPIITWARGKAELSTDRKLSSSPA